jgi:PIN domain nuclease of toxin-antitoxin system
VRARARPAIIWYVHGSKRLSEPARAALAEAEADGGFVISIASLIDQWYVTQTTEAVTA